MAQTKREPTGQLPVRYLSSFAPGQWQIRGGRARLVSEPILGEPRLCDLWEFRERFLGIEKNDEVALLEFLNRTGFWDRQFTTFVVEDLWKDQLAIRFLLTGKPNESFGKDSPWPFNMLQRVLLQSLQLHSIWMYEPLKIPPTLELSSVGTRAALYVSVWLDLVRKAEFRYCARPDCPEYKPTQNPFEAKRTDQIYCSQYCAHVESQRRKRAERKHGSRKRR
jgi:hypothetical protein